MEPNQSEFAGKVVLVTGGTKGVGRGIAETFLGAQATVVICARNQPESLPGVDGRCAEFHACDVREAEQLQALVAQVVARHGRLDVLVHNVGGAPHADAATASPRFHEGVVIVCIGSISALRPSPGTAAYGAAKAAILSLVSSLAVEWAPKVRVVAVSPGLVRTEQSHMHYGDDSGIAAVAATIPAGRLAEPGDVGQACLFVASQRASYMSGSNLLLHGGGERPAFLAAATAGHS